MDVRKVFSSKLDASGQDDVGVVLTFANWMNGFRELVGVEVKPGRMAVTLTMDWEEEESGG